MRPTSCCRKGGCPSRGIFWGSSRGKERSRIDRCKPHVGNGEVHADGLLLRVLEAVDVLGDTRVISPQAEHGGQEGDDVGGFEAAAAVIEAVKEVAEGELVIKVQFFLEGEDPRLLNVCFDE